MKKVLTLLVVCFMALGARMAMADVRTDSLGLTAGQQVDDLDSIWLFPQDAANYGNVADYRLGALGSDTSWGGMIAKDSDDIGFIGVYFNRPFNENNGITPNVNAADQNGILNGNTNWANMVNPAASSYWANFGNPSGNYLGDNAGFINSKYQYFPDGETVGLGYYTDVNLFGTNIIKVADPENKADIFWAKDFSDATLGVHLNYAAQTGGDAENGDAYGSGTGTFAPVAPIAAGTDVASQDNTDSSVIGADLGLTLKSLNLALGLGYSMGSVNYKQVDTRENAGATGTNVTYNDTLKDDNISELRLNALLKSKINDSTTGRIYASARLDNLGFKQNIEYDPTNAGNYTTNNGDMASQTTTYTDTNINLGIACDHNVADGKAHVIGGLGVIYDSRKWSETLLSNLAGSTDVNQVLPGSGSTDNEDWWVVPANVAVEAPLFPWLKARIGASKNLYQNITGKIVQLTNVNGAGTAFQNTTTVSQSWDYVGFVDMSYGVSAEFQNFTLDLQVNPNTFQNYLTAFQPGAGIFYGGVAGMFTQADIRYAF